MMTNSVIRAHEELLKTYENLGMEEYVEKEKKRLKIIKDYYNIKNSTPVQLELKFE